MVAATAVAAAIHGPRQPHRKPDTGTRGRRNPKVPIADTGSSPTAAVTGASRALLGHRSRRTSERRSAATASIKTCLHFPAQAHLVPNMRRRTTTAHRRETQRGMGDCERPRCWNRRQIGRSGSWSEAGFCRGCHRVERCVSSAPTTRRQADPQGSARKRKKGGGWRW